MENREELLKQWLREQETAHVHGWDFSHIEGRYEEEHDLPWNYEEIVRRYLRPEMKLLDIDTGGGEFLLSLGHPHYNLAATENYEPNVRLCKRKLSPLGINFKRADGRGILPFGDQSFDIIINRHGALNPNEISRVLKNGGIFITEQVGAYNDRELVELLFDDIPDIPFPKQCLAIVRAAFLDSGFSVIETDEAFRPIKFWDVGALVWFARIIEWEFPNFNVEDCLDHLYYAQEILEQKGVIEGKIHRFLLAAGKQ